MKINIKGVDTGVTTFLSHEDGRDLEGCYVLSEFTEVDYDNQEPVVTLTTFKDLVDDDYFKDSVLKDLIV